MRRFREIYLAGLLICIMCCFFRVNCKCQSTLHVPTVYPTIQEALNFAGNIDTIEIDEGEYFESLMINQHAVFKGNEVIISGDSIVISSGKSILFLGNFIINAQVKLQTGIYGTATFFKQGNLIINNQVVINKKIINDLPNFFSSPINNATAEIFLGSYLSYYDEGIKEFSFIINEEEPLYVASGYNVFTNNFNDTNVVIEGYPYFEDVQKPLQCSGLIKDGYGLNLIGNPYVSYINWDSFEKPTGLGHAIYYYDPENEKYRFYIDGIGNTSSFIPPMQGFFVIDTNRIQTTEINFSQNFCVKYDYGDYFSINKNKVVGLSILGNGKSDETFIHFDENSSNGFDLSKDALKISPIEPDGYIALYTSNSNSYSFAVNSMPAVGIVRLFFKADLSGSYTLQLTEISDFSGLWLEDIVTDDIIDLLTDSYTFEYNSFDEPGRFYIHFTPVGNNDPPDILKVFANGNNIHIYTPDNTNNYFASARDVFGKEILAQVKLAPGHAVIQAEPDKCYFVKILINTDEERTYTVYTYNYYPDNKSNTFSLFPNPFTNTLNFVKAGSFQSDCTIAIMNNFGQEIKRFRSDKNEDQIDLEYLEPGVYYFVIKSDNSANVEVKKMIKR